MDELFTSLTRAVEGVWWIGLSAAFAWGILSILLSPCHLASIPLIVGFIDEQGVKTTRRACLLSTIFSTGILITIAAIGVITALMGRMAGDIGVWGNYLMGGIFLVVGLHFLEVIPNPFKGANISGVKGKGILPALILGLVFGIALGPCTFAYMAPLLATAFRVGSSDFLHAAMLLLFYGIGHCLVIVFAGTFSEVVQHYLHWNEKSSGAIWLKRICGVLVLIAGFYTIWKS